MVMLKKKKNGILKSLLVVFVKFSDSSFAFHPRALYLALQASVSKNLRLYSRPLHFRRVSRVPVHGVFLSVAVEKTGNRVIFAHWDRRPGNCVFSMQRPYVSSPLVHSYRRRIILTFHSENNGRRTHKANGIFVRGLAAALWNLVRQCRLFTISNWSKHALRSQ